MEKALARVAAGEEDPPCRTCGGILKSATISFGQSLVPEVIDRAYTVAEEADVVLAVGTTLSVYPAANVVPIAKRNGAYVIILNAEPTEMDDDRRRGPPRLDQRGAASDRRPRCRGLIVGRIGRLGA